MTSSGSVISAITFTSEWWLAARTLQSKRSRIEQCHIRNGDGHLSSYLSPRRVASGTAPSNAQQSPNKDVGALLRSWRRDFLIDSFAPEQRQASRIKSKSESGQIPQDYRYEESLQPGQKRVHLGLDVVHSMSCGWRSPGKHLRQVAHWVRFGEYGSYLSMREL